MEFLRSNATWQMLTGQLEVSITSLQICLSYLTISRLVYLAIKFKSALERQNVLSHVFFNFMNYTTLPVMAKILQLPYLGLHAVFWKYISYSTLHHFAHSLISVLCYHTKAA